MVKVLVRAIGVFGRMCSMADKYEEPPPGPDNYDLAKSYDNVESFLKKHGRIVIPQQIKNLPHLDDGIITSPNAGSSYIFNKCLVANLFESGNGFNYNGVYHAILSAGVSKKDIQTTFSLLKDAAGWQCSNYWKDNPRFKKEVEIPRNIYGDMTNFLSLNSQKLITT